MDFYEGEILCQPEVTGQVRTFFEAQGATSVEVLDGRVKIITSMTTLDALNIVLARLRAQVPGVKISKFTVWKSPQQD